MCKFFNLVSNGKGTINVNDDPDKIKEKCLNHDIIRPFNDKKTLKVNNKDVQLLKKWDSIRGSVWYTVKDSVEDSIRDSFGDSIGCFVVDIVLNFIANSFWCYDKDSLWAYISSYFQLEKWKYIKHRKNTNPFQSCIDLWNKCIVPSFDGKTWRLHGYEGKIIWEDKKHIIK